MACFLNGLSQSQKQFPLIPKIIYKQTSSGYIISSVYLDITGTHSKLVQCSFLIFIFTLLFGVFLFKCVYLCLCVCHVCAVAHGGQKGVLHLLEQESQVIMSHLQPLILSLSMCVFIHMPHG